MRAWLLLTLLSFVISFASSSCVLDVRSERAHLVAEKCDGICSFSLGFAHDGLRGLTYAYPRPWRGTYLSLGVLSFKVGEKVYSTSPYGPIKLDPWLEELQSSPAGLSCSWKLEELRMVEHFTLRDEGVEVWVRLENLDGYEKRGEVRLLLDLSVNGNDAPRVFKREGFVEVEGLGSFLISVPAGAGVRVLRWGDAIAAFKPQEREGLDTALAIYLPFSLEARGKWEARLAYIGFESCVDRVRNQRESDIDCGGPCEPCGVGMSCSVDADCATGLCEQGVCVQQRAPPAPPAPPTAPIPHIIFGLVVVVVVVALGVVLVKRKPPVIAKEVVITKRVGGNLVEITLSNPTPQLLKDIVVVDKVEVPLERIPPDARLEKDRLIFRLPELRPRGALKLSYELKSPVTIVKPTLSVSFLSSAPVAVRLAAK